MMAELDGSDGNSPAYLGYCFGLSRQILFGAFQAETPKDEGGLHSSIPHGLSSSIQSLVEFFQTFLGMSYSITSHNLLGSSAALFSL